MRTYYLFIIKNEFYEAYSSSPSSLYKTLENLYHFRSKDYRFGLSLYHQLCELQNVSLLSYYLKEKKFTKKGNLYLVTDPFEEEKTVLEVRPSVLVIRTNHNIPSIFKILHYYNHYLFVCDFKNKDYFWLSHSIHKKLI